VRGQNSGVRGKSAKAGVGIERIAVLSWVGINSRGVEKHRGGFMKKGGDRRVEARQIGWVASSGGRSYEGGTGGKKGGTQKPNSWPQPGKKLRSVLTTDRSRAARGQGF